MLPTLTWFPRGVCLILRERDRLLSTLVQVHHQVWLAQSPLTEACKRTLWNLPVVRGEHFCSTVLEALENIVQATRPGWKLSGLHRCAPPHSGLRSAMTI